MRRSVDEFIAFSNLKHMEEYGRPLNDEETKSFKFGYIQLISGYDLGKRHGFIFGTIVTAVVLLVSLILMR